MSRRLLPVFDVAAGLAIGGLAAAVLVLRPVFPPAEGGAVMTDIEHVVQWSGGITSWAVAAHRVAKQYGTDNLVLLFADTLVEDEDLYRFNEEASARIGVPITRVADGRTPQQVLRDARWLGSAKLAPCSHLLKQKVCRDWLTENADPAKTVLYVGVDWSEMHRIPSIERNWAPWTVKFPLCEPPYVDKHGWMDELRAIGIEVPRLYRLGFAHNNCGGDCVRAGQAQWARLLEAFPERFASWEAFEQEMRAELGKDVAILRDRRGGTTKPLPLTVLRSRIEADRRDAFDVDDWGGCGCFTAVDEPTEAVA